MIIDRIIQDVKVQININESNEIYLPQYIVNKMKNDGIGGIINALYESLGKEYIPLSAFWEITSRCNFNCPFCYIHSENSSIVHRKDWNKIIDFFVKQGLLYCTLSGGEALLHPDFKEIYKRLKTSGVLVSVFTNGSLIDKDLIEIFTEYKPFKLEISLYGSTDEVFRRVTQTKQNCLEKIKTDIINLKQRGVNVICKTPITTLNEEDIPNIRNWCNKNEIEYYTGVELMPSYSGDDRTKYLASSALIDSYRDESNQKFWQNPDKVALVNAECQIKKNFDCNGGKTEIFISSQGELLPCMKGMYHTAWKFSVKELGLEKAYGMMLDKILKIKGTPLKYCIGCSHHKICNQCLMDYDENLEEVRKEYCKALARFSKGV